LRLPCIRQPAVRHIDAAEVPPCDRDPCPTYGPDDPVDAVLELRGGRAEQLGLELGDSVEVEELGG